MASFLINYYSFKALYAPLQVSPPGLDIHDLQIAESSLTEVSTTPITNDTTVGTKKILQQQYALLMILLILI